MGNPAAELLEIFERWASPPDQSPGDVRPLRDTEEIGTHIRAATLLRDIQIALTRQAEDGARVAGYQRLVPEWARAVFVWPYGWTNNQPNSVVFSTHAMDMLEALAGYFESLPRAVDANDLSRVIDLITDVQAELDGDGSIPDPLRRYIKRCLERAREAVVSYHNGVPWDLRDSMEDLWVGMNAAAHASTSKTSRWNEFLQRFAYPVGVGLALTVGSAVQQQITGS